MFTLKSFTMGIGPAAFAGRGFLCLLLLCHAGELMAQGPGRLIFSTRNHLTHDIAVLDNADPGDQIYVQNELAVGLVSDSWARYVKPLGGNDYLRLSAGLRLSDYPEVKGFSTQRLNTRLEYWNTLDETTRKWQLRTSVHAALAAREGSEFFHFLRGDIALYRRYDQGDQAWIRLRATRRDYNEEQIRGFDQDIGQVIAGFRKRGDFGLRQELWMELVAETSSAERKRYGYTRYKLTMRNSWPLASGPLDIIAEGQYWQRKFDAPFSAVFPEARDESRLSLAGGLRWHISERMRLNATAGWLHHDSNIPAFDTSGAGAWLVFEYRSNGFF